MKLKLTLIFVLCALLGPCCLKAGAQATTPEEQLKEIQKGIDYKLEDWQIFYVDSIMTHDFLAMNEELQQLQKTKATNTELYQQIQDKWMDQMYEAFHKVLDEKQWARYLKNGGEREKKNREKRAAKREKSQQ